MRNAIIGCLIVVVIILIGGLLFITCRARQDTAAPTAQSIAASQPTIKITWPPNGARVKVGQQFQVHALATDPRGIFSIEIAVDGQPGTPGTASPPITTFSTALPITLQTKGIHTIAVRANSTTGTKSEVVSIKVVAVQNPSDPPAADDPPTPVPQVPSSPASASSASQPAPPAAPPADQPAQPAAPPADQPAQPPPPAGASVNFVANPTSVPRGQCSMLRWDVEGVREVYFEGVGVTGHEERQQCPTQTTTYTLRVVFTDGSARNYTATVTVTGGDGGAASFAVSNVTLSVNRASYSGPCPNTFTAGARITTNGAGVVRYRWERSDGTQSDTRTLQFQSAGEQVATNYDWQIAQSGNYWVRLHVLEPNDVLSNRGETAWTCAGGASGQAPPAPRNCRGSPSGTGVYLVWETVLPRDWDGFRVYQRGVSQPIRTFTDKTTIAGAVENLTPNTTYHLDVRAYNAFGESPADACAVDVKTNPASGGQAPPAAPSNLRQAAVAPVGKIALEWNDNSNNEDGFDIERVATDGTATRIATANANATGASVDAPPCGTTYQFQVSARNSAGYSAASNRISVQGPACSGRLAVTNVSVGDPQHTFSGACPHTFNLSGNITVNAPGTVTYRWVEDGGAKSDSYTLEFGGNFPLSRGVSYPWQMNTSGTQKVHLETIAPNAKSSSKVTLTLTCASPASVTLVSVSINPTAFTGTCPHTFHFTGIIRISAAGTVTYRWERSDGNSDTRTLTFSAAGDKTVESGDFKAGSSGTYWARLHVLTPNDKVSNQATFTLTCK